MSQVSRQVIQSIEREMQGLVKAAGEYLEAEGTEPQQALVAVLAEISGVCAMLELSGGQRLVQEAQAVLSLPGAATDGASPVPMATLAPALKNSLKLLPDYVRYAAGLPWESPCLVLPEITELRRLQGKPPVYEYQMLPNTSWLSNSKLQETIPLSAVDIDALKRLRHLYQLGLLDVIQNRNRAKALLLLGRAASRLKRLFSSAAETYYWSLVESLLSALAAEQLAIRPDRLRLLSAIERQLNLLANPEKYNGRNPYPLGLWGALGGLVALTPAANEVDARMRQWIGLPELDFTDSDITEIRRLLYAETPKSRVSTLEQLREQLSSLHDLLDMLDEQVGLRESEIRLLGELANGIAERCNTLGLATAATRFRDHAQVFDQPSAEVTEQESVALPRQVAESLLYLEALLADLGEEISQRELIELNLRPVNRTIQTCLLQSAQQAVWEESVAKLTAAKALVDDFAGGLAHEEIIPELIALFDAIRGSARLLDETRVVDIAWRCRDFVAETLAAGQADTVRLALFADAVISLEYYLDCCVQGQLSDHRPLDIADDYLAQLGA